MEICMSTKVDATITCVLYRTNNFELVLHKKHKAYQKYHKDCSRMKRFTCLTVIGQDTSLPLESVNKTKSKQK